MLVANSLLAKFGWLLDSMTYESFAVSLQIHRRIISSLSLIVYCCIRFMYLLL